MARRPLFLVSLVALTALIGGGAVVAQLESGDRGIPPIDSASTLEIDGIKVDVAAKDAESARLAGWRLAQRQGFKQLWAQYNKRPVSEAPNLPDSTLDGLVSSISIDDEMVAPGRYVATLGILFDRSRSAGLLGAGSVVRQSAPLLLIPVTVSGGTATSVELRNAWQRAWAEFRTSGSAIDYVRISGQGTDPLLATAAQTRRPGRRLWRNLVDSYGAADVLVAQVQMRRLYPGGPAIATFTGFFGPDRKPLGTFTLRSADGAGISRMMSEGVRQMDALFSRWQADGRLRPDPSLIVPELPPPPVEEEEEVVPEEKPAVRPIQITVTSPYSPVGWLLSIPGVSGVRSFGPQVLVVQFAGTQEQLSAALRRRGWQTTVVDTVLTITGYSPPAVPFPNPNAPPPQAPPQPQPQPQPSLPEPLANVQTNQQGR